MTSSAREAYLDTRISTATPQRLRLMLIDEALRQARLALAAGEANPENDAAAAVVRCRDVVAELIAGIRPEDSPVARQVLGLYLFLYSALTESRISLDRGRLSDIVRVLEEERVTWDEVCQRYPERIAAASPPLAASEEVAPQRVAAALASTYGPTQKVASAAFSIEA